jgi:hypothetical protein
LLMVRRWWIFAFIVSLIVFSSALLLLGGEAYAKPGGGGGDGLTGGLPSGGGDSNKGGSDAAKGGGGGANLDGKAGGVLKAGGDAPANNISSGDSKPSRDVLGDATGSLRDIVKNDGSQSLEGTPYPTAENSEPLIGSAERVADTAEPMMKPVGPRLGEEVARIGQAIDPVAEEAAKTVEPVKEVTDPVITPIKETVAPVVEPLSEAVRSTLAPLAEETSPLLESLGSPLEPAFAPVTGAAEPVFEPVVAERVVPLLSDQPSWLQTGESPAYWTASPALATAAAASTSLDSGAAPVDQVNLEGSASSATMAKQQVTMRTGVLSGPYLEQVGLSLFDEGLAYLNPTGTKGTQNQMPQPFPAGGMPVAAGGFSGGSTSSSSGGGLDTGILGLLAVLLLGGKFLWSARDFLKPNTAPLLAIERPG